MKKAFTLFALLTLIYARLHAQVSDNAGKDIFVVKNVADLSFPLSTSSISINYIQKSTFKKKSISYYKEATLLAAINLLNGSGQVTNIITRLQAAGNVSSNNIATILSIPAEKTIFLKALDDEGLYAFTSTDVGTGYSPVFVNFKISNLVFKSLGDFFTGKNQPTLQLEVGSIFNTVLRFNWEKLKTSNKIRVRQFDLFYSLFINTNLITYYDTTSHIKTPTDWSSFLNFSQAGAKVNSNLYLSRRVAFALTATGFYGLPLEGAKSFQSKALVPVSTNPADAGVSVAGTAEGKFGGSITSQSWNGRFSIGMPIFLGKDSGTAYLVPHFTYYGSFAPSNWNRQFGLSINLLTKRYGGIGSGIVQGGGFGVDFISDEQKKTGWGSAVLYFTGSLNLGKTISSFTSRTDKNKPSKGSDLR